MGKPLACTAGKPIAVNGATTQNANDCHLSRQASQAIGCLSRSLFRSLARRLCPPYFKEYVQLWAADEPRVFLSRHVYGISRQARANIVQPRSCVTTNAVQNEE